MERYKKREDKILEEDSRSASGGSSFLKRKDISAIVAK